MRAHVLTFAALALSAFLFACENEQPAPRFSTTSTTSATVDAGPVSVPYYRHGWDNPRSVTEVPDPPRSILDDTGSR